MRLGIDFDNTIACYDTVFHRAAARAGLLPAVPVLTKAQVRDTLRRQGREYDWTALQGEVYGPGMRDVAPFAGVLEGLRTLRERGVDVFIISHKTRTPYRGPAWDLHQCAGDWLERQGCFELLTRPQVFFELTLAEKLQRIARQGCTHFIDDLPELLAEPAFPPGVTRLLFDPDDVYPQEPYQRFRTWPEMVTWILQQP